MPAPGEYTPIAVASLLPHVSCVLLTAALGEYRRRAGWVNMQARTSIRKCAHYGGPLVQVVRNTPQNISNVQHTTSKYFRCAEHHLKIFQMCSTPPQNISDVQHTTSKYFRCAAHHLEIFQMCSTPPQNIVTAKRHRGLGASVSPSVTCQVARSMALAATKVFFRIKVKQSFKKKAIH